MGYLYLWAKRGVPKMAESLQYNTIQWLSTEDYCFRPSNNGKWYYCFWLSADLILLSVAQSTATFACKVLGQLSRHGNLEKNDITPMNSLSALYEKSARLCLEMVPDMQGPWRPVWLTIWMLFICYMRGAVVEWLECLAVVRKIAGSSPAQAKDWKTHCQPSGEWVPD